MGARVGQLDLELLYSERANEISNQCEEHRRTASPSQELSRFGYAASHPVAKPNTAPAFDC